MAVKITVHRGTDQIGGTVTEIAAGNTRILIDFGANLPSGNGNPTDEAVVNRIKASVEDKAVDGVLFTHIHGDHIGLLDRIPEIEKEENPITLGMGKYAKECYRIIHRTLGHDRILKILDRPGWKEFEDGIPFHIGDFTITPVSVDHSAFDSYMFIIEAEGKCIVHTGDFRVHGRLGEGFFERLGKYLEHREVDVLITEGTMLSRTNEEPENKKETLAQIRKRLTDEIEKENIRVYKEKELQLAARMLLKKHQNAIVVCSSTNVESLASFHNAAKEYGRRLYVNSYVYEQMELYSRTVGQVNHKLKFDGNIISFERLKDLNARQMKEDGFVMLITNPAKYLKFAENFKDEKTLLIYSMWDGYLGKKGRDEKEKRLHQNDDHIALWDMFGDNRRILHTGGHAYPKHIMEMTETVKPKEAIIPIHTERKRLFARNLPELAKPMDDGETYYIGMDHKGVADETAKLLEKNRDEWEGRYGGYISKMNKNGDFVKEACKAFNPKHPLKKYLTVGRVLDASKTVGLDLRVMGHSVGWIKAAKNETGKKIRDNARVFFSEGGLLKAAERVNAKMRDTFIQQTKALYNEQPEDGWEWNDKKVKKFRSILQVQEFELTSEHSVESLLLGMLKEKYRIRKDENLAGIQPCTLCGQYYQLRTPIKGSHVYENILKYSGPYGGGIDILARAKGKLCVIELKDSYESEESPEKAIKQAIAYAAFIIKLIRSEKANGSSWYERFGLGLPIPKELTVNAVIAMPYPENWEKEHTAFAEKPSSQLYVGSDIIKLHYMYFKKDERPEPHLKNFTTSLFKQELL